MRRLIAITILIPVIVLGFQSCKNELDINGDYIEKVVVWGLLDAGSDTNFIRINKSFLDESTGALVLATDPYNLYYPDTALEVYMEEWRYGAFIKRISVDYVDGDTIGIHKDEGIFATSPNILYRIATPLDTFATYKLFIVKNETQDTLTSETNLVHDFFIYYPTRTGSFMDYADTSKIVYTCKAAVNGKLYELWMHFNYWEKTIATGDSVLKTIPWQIYDNIEADNITGTGNISYGMYRYSFFTFLSSSLEPDNKVVRTFKSLEFHFYSGGIELYDQYLNMVANLGINEQYISPEYTNINGGLGIFSSRFEHMEADVFLNNETLDSIACGVITAQLRFVSSPVNPYYPGCEF